MQPIVNGLEEEYGEVLTFERVNANIEPGRTMLRAYGLRGHPSYAIVDQHGERLWSATGILAEDVIAAGIDRSLQ